MIRTRVRWKKRPLCGRFKQGQLDREGAGVAVEFGGMIREYSSMEETKSDGKEHRQMKNRDLRRFDLIWQRRQIRR